MAPRKITPKGQKWFAVGGIWFIFCFSLWVILFSWYDNNTSIILSAINILWSLYPPITQQSVFAFLWFFNNAEKQNWFRIISLIGFMGLWILGFVLVSIPSIIGKYLRKKRVEREAMRRREVRLRGLSRIDELVSDAAVGLDMNWAVATCYFCAMEIVINKKRKELGLRDKPEDEKRKKSFKERFGELVEKLEEEGVKVRFLEKELTPLFWNLREPVVHGGRSLDAEELKTVIEWSKRVIELLTK